MNVLTLCDGCHHDFAHKFPVRFENFIRSRLGDNMYEELKRRSLRKITTAEAEEMVRVFKETADVEAGTWNVMSLLRKWKVAA